MLYSAAIIRAVACAVAELKIPNLVVDPVMVSTSGARLLREDAVNALCRELIPLARVMTPNLDEAGILCGRRLRTLRELKAAALELSGRFGVACVVKGGHLRGGRVTDVLAEAGRTCEFHAGRVRAAETHGTGCTFSAAVAALLAGGLPLPKAVEQAQAFVVAALARAVPVGRHRPLGVGGAAVRP
jgi:hydroxymethylpyrimidine/phosphomethylpyrimidine kinase